MNDIEFDPDGMYGGLMYVSISSKTIDYNGICSVDLDGSMTQYEVGTKIGMIEFDATEDKQFDGLLYMMRSSYAIKHMYPDGSAKPFIFIGDSACVAFTFGPDGMYWLEKTGETTYTIHRVKRFNLLDKAIESIENAIVEKQVAIDSVTANLAEEQVSYDTLAEVLTSGDLGSLTELDITKAMKKIEVSIAEQSRVIGDLEDSIVRLELSLSLLGVESEKKIMK